MPKQHYNILGIGSALVDTEIKLSDNELNQLAIEKGLMTLVEQSEQTQILDKLQRSQQQLHKSSGGSAGNSIYAASLFGSSCGFICKVADDTNGNLYINDMQSAGINVSTQHFDSELVTGECLVMVTEDAERTMCTYLGVSANIDTNDVPDNWSADVAYIESYLATSENGCRAVNKLCQQIREQTGKIALSLSDPGIVQFFKQQIHDMVNGKVDIVFCNSEEAVHWAGVDDDEKIFTSLLDFANLVVMTDGSKGAYIHDSNNCIHIEGNKVDVIDTNGAGDMFAGAFLAAYIEGRDLAFAGQFACKAASEVVCVFASRLSLEGYQDIRKELA